MKKVITIFMLLLLVIQAFPAYAMEEHSEMSEYEKITEEIAEKYGLSISIEHTESKITVTTQEYRALVEDFAQKCVRNTNIQSSDIADVGEATGKSYVSRNILTGEITRDILDYFELSFDAYYIKTLVPDNEGNYKVQCYFEGVDEDTLAINTKPGCYGYTFEVSSIEPRMGASKQVLYIDIVGNAYVSSGGIIVEFASLNTTEPFRANDEFL